VGALTSAISLLEVVVATAIDQLGWSRPLAAIVLGQACALLGLPAALDLDVLGLMDQVAGQLFLVFGGLMLSLFVGWVMPDPVAEARRGAPGIKWFFAWRGLVRTARDLDGFDGDDARWLTRRKPAPQGRFNAGQKLNASLTAAFTLLFLVSGLLLWFGERDTRFRFESTVLLHDGLMYFSLVLLVGHLYLAVLHPATRHALRGMTLGTVDEEWAARHHSKWRPE